MKDFWIEAVIDKAIKTYGEEMQINVAIEEMSELIQALIKDRRKRVLNDSTADTVAHVLEEIADVQIMLWQLEKIYSTSENEKKFFTNLKIKRLEERLREQEKTK